MIRALLALLLLASPLAAQDKEAPLTWFPHTSPCGPERPLLELLAQEEQLLLFVGIGQVFGANGVPLRGTMMTFTNQETGRYTIVLRSPNGQMCMIMSGDNFRPYDGEIPQLKDKL